MADISKQLEDLLLLLRSRHAKEENLKIDSIPTSPQLSESLDFNRPDPKPIYEIKSDIEIPKASSLSKRRYKLRQRILCEEIEERRLKGLCVFCEEPETPNHYLQHKNSGILMIDSEDHLSNSMVKEIGIEISSDRWLSSSIDCELETGEIDNDEDQVLSDSDLVVNDIEKVKKDLVAIDVDRETDSLIENNQKFQEEAKNRSTNSVLQPSLVSQMCSLLKEQVQEAQEENSRVENHKNWVQHVLLEEDSTIHFHEPVSKSENLRKMEVNSVLNNREAVVSVVERFRQVTSVTKKFSTRQLFGKKFKDKDRLQWKKRRKSLKSWRFKFKSRDLRGYNLSRVKLLLKNSLNNSEPVLTVSELERKKKKLCYKTWMFKYKAPLKGVQFLHYCDKEVLKETNWAVQRIWDKDSHEVHITDANTQTEYTREGRRGLVNIYDWCILSQLWLDHRNQTCYVSIEDLFKETDAYFLQQEEFEQLLKTTLITQQVMRNKKIKFSKRWWFKYKNMDEGLKRLHIQLVYKCTLELEEWFAIWSRRESGKKRKKTQQFMIKTEEEIEDMMEEDQKQQQGDSEPLVTVPDFDAKGGVGMDKKQSHLSLRNNRVWDPGRSLVKDATPWEFSLHFTATVSFHCYSCQESLANQITSVSNKP